MARNRGNGTRLERALANAVPSPTALERTRAEEERKKQQQTSNMGAFYDTLSLQGAYFAQYRMGLEKPMGTANFFWIRKAFGISPIDKLVIRARRYQLRHMARILSPESTELGITVQHKEAKNPSVDTNSPDIKEQINRALDILGRVNETIHQDFTNWFASNGQDELLYDRKVLINTRNYRREPLSYHSVDPTTVRPVVEVLLPWIMKEAQRTGLTPLNVAAQLEHSASMRDRAMMQLSDEYGVDLTNAAYVQIVDGLPVASWRSDEITVHISNPVNEINRIFYGVSDFENSLEFTDQWFVGFKYTRNMFNFEYPETMVVVAGDPEEKSLLQMRDQVRNSGAGQENRMVFVGGDDLAEQGGGIYIHKLRDNPRDMAFPELMQNMTLFKCAAYRMHPSTINVSEAANGGVQFNQAGTDELKINMAIEEGFHSLANQLCDFLYRALLRPLFPDLRVVPLNLDEEDEEKVVKNLAARTWVKVNELRAADRKLRLEPIDDERGDKLLSQVGISLEQLISADKQQEAALAAGQQPDPNDEGEQQTNDGQSFLQTVGSPQGVGGDVTKATPRRAVEPVQFIVEIEETET